MSLPERHMINRLCGSRQRGKIMSFGTVEPFKSKKALKDAVASRGADAVMVRDTSAFGNRGVIPVSALKIGTDVIVGPNVYNDRRWYANVKVVKGVPTIA